MYPDTVVRIDRIYTYITLFRHRKDSEGGRCLGNKYLLLLRDESPRDLVSHYDKLLEPAGGFGEGVQWLAEARWL